MQPSLLTEIPLRLDTPDPGRCTECKLSKRERRRAKRERPRRANER